MAVGWTWIISGFPYRACLVAAGDRAAGADHGHRAFAEDQSVAAGSDDDRIAAERADLHRPHILGDDADALAFVNDRARGIPRTRTF